MRQCCYGSLVVIVCLSVCSEQWHWLNQSTIWCQTGIFIIHFYFNWEHIEKCDPTSHQPAQKRECYSIQYVINLHNYQVDQLSFSIYFEFVFFCPVYANLCWRKYTIEKKVKIHPILSQLLLMCVAMTFSYNYYYIPLIKS